MPLCSRKSDLLPQDGLVQQKAKAMDFKTWQQWVDNVDGVASDHEESESLV